MERKYDLVLFGATGFTGQYTVDEVSRVAEEENLKWAIAGRNMAKLQQVLSGSSKRIGKNIEETAILIADTSSPQSLHEMAQQTKVVLNCVGPYQLYGENVVKACIEGGAHHLDISGEPQFLEKMQVLYNAKAKENNVFIIGATGFDSIPAEMGLLYTRKQFKGEVTNIDSFLMTQHGPAGGAVNPGTLESFLYVLSNYRELKPLRRLLFQDPIPPLEHRLPKRSLLFFSKEINKWCRPFVGSDKSVVDRSMQDEILTGRLEKPYEFRPYCALQNFGAVISMIIMGIILGVMSQFSLGRSLIMKYPHIFTFGSFKKGGPSRKQVDETSFSMTFVAHGFSDTDTKDRAGKKPDKTITTKLVGPAAAYVTTPICMVQSAVVLLKEKEKLYHKAGVLPAGAAFLESSLIDRLEKHNMKFTTVSE